MTISLAQEFERVIIHAAENTWCCAIGACTTCGGSMFRTPFYLLHDLPEDLDTVRLWGPAKWSEKPSLPENAIQAAIESNFAFIDYHFEIRFRDNFDLHCSYRDNWRKYTDAFLSLPNEVGTREKLMEIFQSKYDELDSWADRSERLAERINIHA